MLLILCENSSLKDYTREISLSNPSLPAAHEGQYISPFLFKDLKKKKNHYGLIQMGMNFLNSRF